MIWFDYIDVIISAPSYYLSGIKIKTDFIKQYVFLFPWEYSWYEGQNCQFFTNIKIDLMKNLIFFSIFFLNVYLELICKAWNFFFQEWWWYIGKKLAVLGKTSLYCKRFQIVSHENLSCYPTWSLLICGYWALEM